MVSSSEQRNDHHSRRSSAVAYCGTLLCLQDPSGLSTCTVNDSPGNWAGIALKNTYSLFLLNRQSTTGWIYIQKQTEEDQINYPFITNLQYQQYVFWEDISDCDVRTCVYHACAQRKRAWCCEWTGEAEHRWLKNRLEARVRPGSCVVYKRNTL